MFSAEKAIQILKRLSGRREPRQVEYVFDIRDGDKIILKTERHLSVDQIVRVREMWEAFLQSDSKVAVLDATFTPIILRRK